MDIRLVVLKLCMSLYGDLAVGAVKIFVLHSFNERLEKPRQSFTHAVMHSH